MQTNFTENQLKDKDNQSSEKIFKKCVHCGMCNATCPTYGILGDELDGPSNSSPKIPYVGHVALHLSLIHI